MAITEKAIINRVRELTGLSEAELPRPRILALIKDARVELARRHPQATKKTYSTVAATSGVADISSLLSDTDPLFTEMIGRADVFLDGYTRKSQFLPDLSLLGEERPSAFPYHALVGNDLRIKAGGDWFTGNVTVTGVSIPALATIEKLELEQALVQIISSWTLGSELTKVEAVAGATKE